MTENRIRLSEKQQLYKGCPLNKNSQGYLKIPCFIIDIIQGKELRNMNNVSITPYEQVQKLRAIDDIMFQMLAESEKVCQEILRVILDDAKLIVQKVTPQASIANILGRSVRLDALCTLGDGTICNIEVQKKNDNDDLRRVRYNASSIVSNFSKKGSEFSQIPNVTVVYISQYDVFNSGRTIYHVDSVIRETNTTIDDGLKRVFVNTQYCEKDTSDVGALMRCFLQQTVTDKRFPELTKRFNYLKNNQEGVDSMCKIIEEYGDERAAEATAKTLVNVIETAAAELGSIEKACNLLKVTRKQYDDAKALLEKTLVV